MADVNDEMTNDDGNDCVAAFPTGDCYDFRILVKMCRALAVFTIYLTHSQCQLTYSSHSEPSVWRACDETTSTEGATNQMQCTYSTHSCRCICVRRIQNAVVRVHSLARMMSGVCTRRRHMFDYRKETTKLRIYCNPSNKWCVCVWLGTGKWHTYGWGWQKQSYDYATESTLI